ncbi:hypothetical protein CBR_g26084 [Chara braunii]|uniref:Uncharacterized protein n=1 Tax=Chara braunii TaxID=69332 RepID=A0A388JVV9_CHABU|nr:hypothetical protein CBR_g26084 [Chara braunii]|eukprot:GBG61920.1 hypothetical protein CBR_g26084 [Chara braunii]
MEVIFAFVSWNVNERGKCKLAKGNVRLLVHACKGPEKTKGPASIRMDEMLETGGVYFGCWWDDLSVHDIMEKGERVPVRHGVSINLVPMGPSTPGDRSHVSTPGILKGAFNRTPRQSDWPDQQQQQQQRSTGDSTSFQKKEAMSVLQEGSRLLAPLAQDSEGGGSGDGGSEGGSAVGASKPRLQGLLKDSKQALSHSSTSYAAGQTASSALPGSMVVMSQRMDLENVDMARAAAQAVGAYGEGATAPLPAVGDFGSDTQLTVQNLLRKPKLTIPIVGGAFPSFSERKRSRRSISAEQNKESMNSQAEKQAQDGGLRYIEDEAGAMAPQALASKFLYFRTEAGEQAASMSAILGNGRSAKIQPFLPPWCNSNGVTPIVGCNEVL